MSGSAWMERRWWWMPLCSWCWSTWSALIWYGLVYSGYARRVDQQLERRQRELGQLEAERGEPTQAAERLRRNDGSWSSSTRARLAPPSERLTDVIREVCETGSTVGLRAVDDQLPGGRARRLRPGRSGLSPSRSSGSYAQLRRFINLLELTDSFLTLEEVRMAGAATMPSCASACGCRPCSRPRRRAAESGRAGRAEAAS